MSGKDNLTLSLTYYYCQKKSLGLCKVGSVIWTVPLELSADSGAPSVQLKHKIVEFSLLGKLKLP